MPKIQHFLTFFGLVELGFFCEVRQTEFDVTIKLHRARCACITKVVPRFRLLTAGLPQTALRTTDCAARFCISQPSFVIYLVLRNQSTSSLAVSSRKVTSYYIVRETITFVISCILPFLANICCLYLQTP